MPRRSATTPDARLWNREADALLRTLLSLRSMREAKRFVRDLMTEDEIRMIVHRFQVARMLAEGRPYRQIEQATGLSSRTVARISRWYQAGRGGYRLMIRRTADAAARRPSGGRRTRRGASKVRRHRTSEN